jgi:hypothetical protein
VNACSWHWRYGVNRMGVIVNNFLTRLPPLSGALHVSNKDGYGVVPSFWERKSLQ